jgi:hypothetical protein
MTIAKPGGGERPLGIPKGLAYVALAATQVGK